MKVKLVECEAAAGAAEQTDSMELMVEEGGGDVEPSSPSPSPSAAILDAEAKLFIRQGKLASDDLVNTRSNAGGTALHWAASNGRADVLGWLLAQDDVAAIVNVEANNQISPLWEAVRLL